MITPIKWKTVYCYIGYRHVPNWLLTTKWFLSRKLDANRVLMNTYNFVRKRLRFVEITCIKVFNYSLHLVHIAYCDCGIQIQLDKTISNTPPPPIQCLRPLSHKIYFIQTQTARSTKKFSIWVISRFGNRPFWYVVPGYSLFTDTTSHSSYRCCGMGEEYPRRCSLQRRGSSSPIPQHLNLLPAHHF